jgi:hypothetical protein
MIGQSSSSVLQPPTAQRDELAAALIERGIPNGEQIADSLDDRDGCMATVAWWDDRHHAKTPGLLVHMLRTGQQRGYTRLPSERESPEARRCRVAREARDAVRALGVTKREEAFAVSAWLTRGPTTLECMRSHLRSLYPWIYEEEN